MKKKILKILKEKKADLERASYPYQDKEVYQDIDSKMDLVEELIEKIEKL
jgi:hypothetical protein